jgi:flagellar motor switch protein FliN/FliY
MRRSANRWQHVHSKRDTTSMGDYSENVLGISAPVSVTVVRKMIPLSEVLDLVPGSVISFDTRCSTPLTLEVGEQPIATGQAVVIGQQLGLRIE